MMAANPHQLPPIRFSEQCELFNEVGKARQGRQVLSTLHAVFIPCVCLSLSVSKCIAQVRRCAKARKAFQCWQKVQWRVLRCYLARIWWWSFAELCVPWPSGCCYCNCLAVYLLNVWLGEMPSCPKLCRRLFALPGITWLLDHTWSFRLLPSGKCRYKFFWDHRDCRSFRRELPLGLTLYFFFLFLINTTKTAVLCGK